MLNRTEYWKNNWNVFYFHRCPPAMTVPLAWVCVCAAIPRQWHCPWFGCVCVQLSPGSDITPSPGVCVCVCAAIPRQWHCPWSVCVYVCAQLSQAVTLPLVRVCVCAQLSPGSDIAPGLGVCIAIHRQWQCSWTGWVCAPISPSNDSTIGPCVCAPLYRGNDSAPGPGVWV